MRQILIMALYCAVLTIPLAACGGTLRVEPDPYDPKLHGQVVRFTVPMVYMQLTDEDRTSFDKKTLSIGKLLTTETTAQSLYNQHGKHFIQKISRDMTFTIVDSYWARNDWFTREFAPDLHMIVLIDNNKNISACLIDALGYSNKRWLVE